MFRWMTLLCRLSAPVYSCRRMCRRALRGVLTSGARTRGARTRQGSQGPSERANGRGGVIFLAEAGAQRVSFRATPEVDLGIPEPIGELGEGFLIAVQEPGGDRILAMQSDRDVEDDLIIVLDWAHELQAMEGPEGVQIAFGCLRSPSLSCEGSFPCRIRGRPSTCCSRDPAILHTPARAVPASLGGRTLVESRRSCRSSTRDAETERHRAHDSAKRLAFPCGSRRERCRANRRAERRSRSCPRRRPSS